MEQSKPEKSNKVKPGNVSTVGLREKRETKRRVLQELARLNKKEFGRKVRSDELIVLALSLLEPKHFAELQERSLSNADKLQKQFQDHVKAHGAISKDEFLGQLMRGEMLLKDGKTSIPQPGI